MRLERRVFRRSKGCFEAKVLALIYFSGLSYRKVSHWRVLSQGYGTTRRRMLCRSLSAYIVGA
ncbi:MAG: hypothetical protein ACK4TI_01750 [Nitrososphaerales archaeon]